MKDRSIGDNGQDHSVEKKYCHTEINISSCLSNNRSLIKNNSSKVLGKNSNDKKEKYKKNPENLRIYLQIYPDKDINIESKTKNFFDYDKFCSDLKDIHINNYTKFLGVPEIKFYKPFYEIVLSSKYEYIFLYRGGISKEEWLNKTKNIRKMPKHLKNTLFLEKNLRNEKFEKNYKYFCEIKQNVNFLYKSKKYRECLNQLYFAYGLFKWIEFKDKNINHDLINNELFSIIDSDIEFKRIPIQCNNHNEYLLFKLSLIYILETMAYCYMELRFYSDAVDCLNECIKITGNYIPDLYLRRAQAKFCNKKAGDDDLNLAGKDIMKSINVALNINTILKNNSSDKNCLIKTDIYYKIKSQFEQIVQKRFDSKIKNIKKILAKHSNNVSPRNNFKAPKVIKNNIDLQYKILKEIKKKYNLAVKCFTELNNNEQLELTYKEYEIFSTTFYQFKSFYKFSPNKIPKNIINKLNVHEKEMLINSSSKNIINKNRINLCKNIFLNGNYNRTLYEYVVNCLIYKGKNQTKNKIISKFNGWVDGLKGKNLMVKLSLGLFIIMFISAGLQILYFNKTRNYLY